MEALRMTRCDSVRLAPDARRVIAKPFLPGEEVYPDGSSRLRLVLDRIMGMSEQVVIETLVAARRNFAGRHRDLDAILERNARIVAARLGEIETVDASFSLDRLHLIGAYFTHEYSIEAAALGNPSIVAAPDQSGVESGAVRFVMSLRAIGEGHRSSIEFRTGLIRSDASVALDPSSDYAVTGERTPHSYDKRFFTTKLHDMAMLNEVEERVLNRLEDEFTMAELEAAIEALDDDEIDRSISVETTRVLHWLASSNYRTSFPASIDLSERVLFPSGPTESHGMEDARFVRFVGDDGAITYYATYTAFDGHQILPQLIETADFTHFRVTTLSGRAAHNKGMAIFPRLINGRYMALGRHDNVNNFIMTSSDVRMWREATVIQEPERPWELTQLGNCGSPLETDAGWLVITHGVGPFRRYTLGAILLDLDDPGRVIGQLTEPLLSPDDDERDGYVPNVVYSCGSMIHAGHLVLPYGYADVGARIATIALDELLSRLTNQ
ncbi:MAG TPA: glycoside hydrolase family 130 protein [Ilumatobacteraceae bacterium]|nr:glycoside hydrolase family 130 protein [Ilumatobacteraceae bacterium]